MEFPPGEVDEYITTSWATKLLIVPVKELTVAWQSVNVVLPKLAKVLITRLTVGLSTIHSADNFLEL